MSVIDTGEVYWLHTDGGVVYTPDWCGSIAHGVPGCNARRTMVTMYANLTEQPGVWCGPRKGIVFISPAALSVNDCGLKISFVYRLVKC